MIQIPPDATVVEDVRLDVIRAVATLHDQHVKAPGGLADQVKRTMTAKKAGFAKSKRTVARLQPGNPRGTIDPRRTWALLKSRSFGIEELLACCTVRREALKNILSEREIESLTTYEPAAGPSLYTEFLPAIAARIDCNDLADALVTRLVRQLA